PILVSVGSTADQAVGAYFPIARLVQSLWHPTRPFRGVSNFLAMGRYWLHTSHHLNWKGDGWGKKKRRREDKSRCECPRDVQSSTQEAGDSGQLSGDFELLHEDWWKDGDPFMVVNAGRRVISDHGDIFNPRFVKFLMDQFVTAPAERQKRERLAGQPSLASRR
ncbi:MAG: hypothetical protein KDD47_13730, partial [Acidobacteria bacterium]|nr:hypothetical protein [Acidobacteriota bacterium]